MHYAHAHLGQSVQFFLESIFLLLGCERCGFLLAFFGAGLLFWISLALSGMLVGAVVVLKAHG
jgi:hypothetical protein